MLTAERIDAVRRMASPTAPPTEDLDRTQQLPQRSSRLQAGQLIADRYRVISLLGEGGMGSVYKVEQVFLRKEFALKTLSAGGISTVNWRRFQKEAKAAALLDHPALIKVQDFGLFDEDQPFFVMDFVEGETLSAILKRGAMPLNMVLEVFQQACLGLGYAHGQGIIHRDIKPSNIMISNWPDLSSLKVKIVDFGIAKVLGFDDPESIALTRTGEIFGTPYYMSPEQCIGTSIDDRSDIYSLGCVMFEALTGLPPFISETALTIMMKHQSEQPPSLREASLGTNFDSEIERVVAKLLEKQPKQRYQSLLDVATDLQRIKNGEPILLGRHRAPISAEKGKTIPQTIYAAFAATLIAASIGTFFLGRATAPHPVATLQPHATAEDSPSKVLLSASDELLNPGAVKQDNRYFSAQTTPTATWRLFHFPKVCIGRISDLAVGSKVYRYKDGEFVREIGPNAHDDLVMDNFKSFALIAAPSLCQNPKLFECFRDGELHSIIFSRNIDVNDNTLNHAEHLKSIKTLEFDQVHQLTSKFIVVLNQFPMLERLSVGQSGLLFQDLLKLKRLKQLTMLDARAVPDDVNAFLSVLSSSKHMTDLSLRRTDVNGAGLEQVAKMPALATLNLSGLDHLQDQDLAPLSKMKSLRALSIEDCGKLTPRCFDYFKHLNLRQLILDRNRFSESEMKALSDALPGCTITGGETGGSIMTRMYPN